MNEFGVSGLVLCGLTVALAVLYATWCEITSENRRDAKLLAAVGSFSLMGSLAAWLH